MTPTMHCHKLVAVIGDVIQTNKLVCFRLLDETVLSH